MRQRVHACAWLRPLSRVARSQAIGALFTVGPRTHDVKYLHGF
jgi:hypothetical protein